MKYLYFYNTPIGEIGIIEEKNAITNILFKAPKNIEEYTIKETDTIKETYKELEEYFDGTRKNFNINIKPKGTEFMQEVWKELQKIPYGKTKSYKEIAKAINNEKAVRAVGMANNKNPIPIIIPCHRVIGSNGKLVGYAGGLGIKEFLLELEAKENLKNL